MLIMCRTDPKLLAEVLGYFIAMASERRESGGGVSESVALDK